MAGKIFINYRRSDSIGTAGRLYDRLAQAFGKNNIFMDVDHIPAGADFVSYLDLQLAECDVFLAVIGPDWLDARDTDGHRRLDRAGDFVAVEIATALRRNILVIPVLVDGARMPKASELPEALSALARRNAVEVRNSQFGRDAEVLVQKVRNLVDGGSNPVTRWLVATAATVVLLLGGGIGLFALGVPMSLPSLTTASETGAAEHVQATGSANVAKVPANVQGMETRAVEEARVKAEQAKREQHARLRAEKEHKADAERQRAAVGKTAAAEQAKAANEQSELKAAEAERHRLAALKLEEQRRADHENALISDPGLLREIRDRLYELNFDPGPIDVGNADMTERAIKEFETQLKLTTNGKPTNRLLRRLRGADSLRPWGSIVYQRDGNKWGMAWARQTRKEAVASAQSSCATQNKNCPVEVSFFGADCSAFAYSPLGWAIMTENGIQQAKKSALTECGKRGRACEIVAAVCADGSEKFADK